MSRLTDELMNSAPWASTEERAEWWRNKCYEVFEELEHYRHLEEQGRLIEQKHGRWKQLDSDIYSNIYFCSNCLVYERVKTVMGKPAFDYCPNCGAKMDEVE